MKYIIETSKAPKFDKPFECRCSTCGSVFNIRPKYDYCPICNYRSLKSFKPIEVSEPLTDSAIETLAQKAYPKCFSTEHDHQKIDTAYYEREIWKKGFKQALSYKGKEVDNEWTNVKDQKPTCYKTGHWDGKQSDLVLCEDNNGEYYLAICYEGHMDGSYFFDWYDKHDYQLECKIIKWKSI